tara:strand:+ start:468 stop:704 length:237 start_codon:yes stop_codon:yes gene_type:complete
LNGHDHHCHLATKNGVHSITSAGAGAPLYKIDFDLPETKKSSIIEHFVNVQINKKNAFLYLTDIKGDEIETIEIKRRK